MAATELASCCSCCWLPVEREIGLAPRLIRLSRLPQSGERHVLCSTAGTAIRSAAGVLCIVRVGAWYMHHPLSLNSGTVSGPEGLYTCYRRCVHCSCFASVSVSVGRGEVLVNRLVPLVRSARSGSPGHTPCPAYVPGSLLQSFRLCHCFSTPFAGGSRKTLRCQLACHLETLAELVLRSSHWPFSVVCQYSNPSNMMC